MRQAIQFLTVIPIPAPAGPPGKSVWAYPIVGMLLGLAAAVLFPLKFGPLLIIIALALITGGLHEDGLADVFDAVRANRTREKMLLILKDSRIGAHGALALIASFVFRWQALSALHGNPWLQLPAAYGISRAAIVTIAAITPAVGDGLGKSFSESLPQWAGPLAIFQILLLAALTGFPTALWLLGANAVALILLRQWFVMRLGGVTGDCLGAVEQISEAVSLGVMACL